MRGTVRLIAWCLAIALVALPIVGVLRGWFAANRWPVTQLTVQAEFKHVTRISRVRWCCRDLARAFSRWISMRCRKRGRAAVGRVGGGAQALARYTLLLAHL
jgi:hypothetical protein